MLTMLLDGVHLSLSLSCVMLSMLSVLVMRWGELLLLLLTGMLLWMRCRISRHTRTHHTMLHTRMARRCPRSFNIRHLSTLSLSLHPQLSSYSSEILVWQLTTTRYESVSLRLSKLLLVLLLVLLVLLLSELVVRLLMHLSC